MHDVAGSTSKLSCIGELKGKIYTTNVARSIGKLSSIGELHGKLSTENVQNEYSGPYEVTSDLFEDTTLKTKDTHMSKDLTLKKVAFVETSNESDGTTVYIGYQN